MLSSFPKLAYWPPFSLCDRFADIKDLDLQKLVAEDKEADQRSPTFTYTISKA